MANAVMLDLPTATSLTGDEYAWIVQGGTDKRVQLSEISSIITGFVPTSRTITAGVGLSGGGSLASDVTLSFDSAELTPTSAMAVTDSFVINSGLTSAIATFPFAMKAIGGLTVSPPLDLTLDKLMVYRAADGLVYYTTPSAIGTAAGNMPAGGTTGQFLVKASNTNYDTAWSSSISGFANDALSNLASVAINTTLLPGANDGAGLGSGTFAFSDLFLASGGVINWNNGDVLITHSANTLAFTGASSGYTFDASVTGTSFIPSASTVPSNGMYLPAANTLGWAINSAAEMQLTASALSPAVSDGNALGTTSNMWSDLFLASGGVINWNNGNVTITHVNASNRLDVSASVLNVVSTSGPSVLIERAGAHGSTTNVGTINFYGTDSGAASQEYARITGYAQSNTAASEVGYLYFGVTNAGSLTNYMVLVNGQLVPAANDGTALGTGGLSWSDLFLATGGVINWANGGITITEVSDALFFSGATNGYQFGTFISPQANDGAALGVSTSSWSDLFLASGGVINWNNGNVIITHSAARIDVSGASVFGVASTAAVNYVAERTSAHGSGADIGYVQFWGRDSASNGQEYARVTGFCFTNTSGAEVGQLFLGVVLNNVLTNYVAVNPAAMTPAANDGTALGSTSTMWSDLFLASGGVINFNNGNVTLTHSANAIAANFGASSPQYFGRLSSNSNYNVIGLNNTNADANIIGLVGGGGADVVLYYFAPTGGSHRFRINGGDIADLNAAAFRPTTNDGIALGSATVSFADLFLASGGVINWNNGNTTLTHSAGLITSNRPWAFGAAGSIVGTLQLFNATSGSITITPTTGALGTITLTLPAISGTVIQTAGNQTFTGGFSVTPANIGSFTSVNGATVTPANGNYQYVTLSGTFTFTLTAPASDCAVDILVILGASGSGVTFAFSGFKTAGTGASGSTFTAANSTWYVLSVRRVNSVSTYSWSGPWT